MISFKVHFSRSYAFLLLAALAVGIAVAPVAVQAQAKSLAISPAASLAMFDQPAVQGASAKKETKSEQEETTEFRHSATVRWFANLLHIDVETAATGFEYFNFLIIVLVVGIPLLRVLPKALRKR